MGSRGSTDVGGATFFLTVVTTVTGDGAILVFLRGGWPAAEAEAEEDVDTDANLAPLTAVDVDDAG